MLGNGNQNIDMCQSDDPTQEKYLQKTAIIMSNNFFFCSMIPEQVEAVSHTEYL